LNQKNLEVLANIAVENDLWVISDEIYSNIVYDNIKYKSIATLPEMLERTIILDGFSKFFSMTGWRLGYAIVNEQLVKHFAKWITNTVSCTATFTQIAGIEAITADKDPSLAMVEEFEKRRDIIHSRLNKIEGISAILPKGAFYIFANVTSACEKLNLKNSLELQEYFLENLDIAVLSRTYFGNKNPEEKEEYIRFSYCISRENIIKGMDRIENLLS
jgi:aspartate/methionine/tyrosine aminotransferase